MYGIKFKVSFRTYSIQTSQNEIVINEITAKNSPPIF